MIYYRESKLLKPTNQNDEEIKELKDEIKQLQIERRTLSDEMKQMEQQLLQVKTERVSAQQEKVKNSKSEGHFYSKYDFQQITERFIC